MTKAVGISPSSVGRIWREAGLKPHRIDTKPAADNLAKERRALDQLEAIKAGDRASDSEH